VLVGFDQKSYPIIRAAGIKNTAVWRGFYRKVAPLFYNGMQWVDGWHCV
jgi:hypothetical protein